MSGEMSFAKAKVEVSTDGTSWTDISGVATAVSVSGGDRQTGEVYSFSDDVPIITLGKREALEVTVKVLYTEGASDTYETVRAAYEGGTPLYVRWSPSGGGTGKFMFTTDTGVVTSAVYPAGESGSGDPVMFEFKVKTAKITKSVIA